MKKKEVDAQKSSLIETAKEGGSVVLENGINDERMKMVDPFGERGCPAGTNHKRAANIAIFLLFMHFPDVWRSME